MANHVETFKKMKLPSSLLSFTFTHPVLFVLACSYIYFLLPDGVQTYQVLLRRLCRDWALKWHYALTGLVVCAFGGFALFLAIQQLHVVERKEVVATAEGDGLNSEEFPQPWMAVGLALEFTFVNSGLEELFWRVFLYRELGGIRGVGSPLSAAPDQAEGDLTGQALIGDQGGSAPTYGGGARSGDEEAGVKSVGGEGRTGAERYADQLGGGQPLCGLPPIETPKILVSAYYASYHFVVMICFVPWCGELTRVVGKGGSPQFYPPPPFWNQVPRFGRFLWPRCSWANSRFLPGERALRAGNGLGCPRRPRRRILPHHVSALPQVGIELVK